MINLENKDQTKRDEESQNIKKENNNNNSYNETNSDEYEDLFEEEEEEIHHVKLVVKIMACFPIENENTPQNEYSNKAQPRITEGPKPIVNKFYLDQIECILMNKNE